MEITGTKEGENLSGGAQEARLSDTETQSYHLNTLPSKTSIPIKQNVFLDGVKTTIELDTDASCSIISEGTDQKHWKSNTPLINVLPINYRNIMEEG